MYEKIYTYLCSEWFFSEIYRVTLFGHVVISRHPLQKLTLQMKSIKDFTLAAAS